MGHSLRPGIALLLVLAGLCSPLRAADARASRTRVARIYLQVNAADGEPVGSLSAGDFSLSAAGRTLPFTIANNTPRGRNRAPAPATHLLVVPGPSLQGIERPCQVLAPVLRARWKVQLLDTSNALPGQSTCPGGSVQVLHGSELQALQLLEQADGRRVLLYLTTANRALSHAIQERETDAGITMYDVGGREPYFIDIEQHPAASIPAEPTKPSAAAVAATRLGPVMEPGTHPGLARPEPSLGTALRDAIRDAAGFYVLTTHLDGTGDALSLQLRQIQPGWTVVARVAVEHGPIPKLDLTE
jgi:hypothetical protein